MKRLLCTGVLLFSATALRADVFSFAYSGLNLSAIGTMTADAKGSGLYEVTDIWGYRNNQAISDSPYGAGLFYYSESAQPPTLGAGGLAFSVNGLGLDTLLYSSNSYWELSAAGLKKLDSFSISRVPEPTTLLLLFTMGLGFWVLARKLPFKKIPSQ